MMIRSTAVIMQSTGSSRCATADIFSSGTSEKVETWDDGITIRSTDLEEKSTSSRRVQ